MQLDVRSLLVALAISLVTMAVALPAVMGRADGPARRAQWAAALQAAGWLLIIASGLVPRGGALDRLLSTLSMTGLGLSLALLGAAFDLWGGRRPALRLPLAVAMLMPLGYAIGFAHYPFRVGWANALLALQTGLVAFAVGRTPMQPLGHWRWLMLASLLAQAVVTVWRGVLGAFFTDAYPRFLTPHPVNVASALVAHATALTTLVGVLLAHREASARELERLAMVDGLTGAFNRRAWMDRAQAELAAGTRYGRTLALLLIDLDHFKQVNDRHGHAAGDAALRMLARELQACARAGDVVGRLGGEEFCVLLAQADLASARAFDRRLRARLADRARDELGFALDFSAGIAMHGGAGDSLEAMLSRADRALYRAKEAGRAHTLTAPGALPQPA